MHTDKNNSNEEIENQPDFGLSNSYFIRLSSVFVCVHPWFQTLCICLCGWTACMKYGKLKT